MRKINNKYLFLSLLLTSFSCFLYGQDTISKQHYNLADSIKHINQTIGFKYFNVVKDFENNSKKYDSDLNTLGIIIQKTLKENETLRKQVEAYKINEKTNQQLTKDNEKLIKQGLDANLLVQSKQKVFERDTILRKINTLNYLKSIDTSIFSISNVLDSLFVQKEIIDRISYILVLEKLHYFITSNYQPLSMIDLKVNIAFLDSKSYIQWSPVQNIYIDNLIRKIKVYIELYDIVCEGINKLIVSKLTLNDFLEFKQDYEDPIQQVIIEYKIKELFPQK